MAKLFVHNGKLKFHFHMKLVNNGFQDSLNKHAQDTVSILSLSTGRQPSGWKINQLCGYSGASEVRHGEGKVSGCCPGAFGFYQDLVWSRFVTLVFLPSLLYWPKP